MFKRMKSALAVATFATLATTANAEELRIGTASLGGAFYPMGQAISNLVNLHAGNDITMVPVVTGGSVQNPRLIDSGEVEIAITNNNLGKLAIAGKGPYKSGAMDISAIAALHPSVLHMIVLADSDIKTFEDIRGKRVAVGPAGGGTLGFLNFLMPLHDMALDEIIPSFLSYSDGFSQLTDGNVDVAFALSGYPAGAVMQASASADLRFISFADGMMEKALEKNAAFGSYEVDADVYDTAEAGTLIGVDNMLIVLNSMDADTVERITASIFDHMDEFRAENANAKQIDPEETLKLAIPLYKGAEQYFAR